MATGECEAKAHLPALYHSSDVHWVCVDDNWETEMCEECIEYLNASGEMEVKIIGEEEFDDAES